MLQTYNDTIDFAGNPKTADADFNNLKHFSSTQIIRGLKEGDASVN